MSRFMTATGVHVTHSGTGFNYSSISWDEVYGLAANPPTTDKLAGQWVILSNYLSDDARSHAAQRDKGMFHGLWVDIDEGDPCRDQMVWSIQQVLGQAACILYSTRSSGEVRDDGSVKVKWRILIPTAEPVAGSQYPFFAKVLNNRFEAIGLTVDRKTEGPGQICFLPNRGPTYEAPYYGGNELLSLHGLKDEAYQLYLEHSARQEAKPALQKNEGKRSHMKAFRDKHPTEALLHGYGFTTLNGIDWHHPSQSSAGYATELYQDGGWFTLSGTVERLLNRKAGDGFDLYVALSCEGNIATATVYANQCLKEKDDERYGDATAEHGRQLINADHPVYISGIPFNRAAHNLALAASEEKMKLIAAEHDPTAPEEFTKHDWDIEYPPSFVLAGMARHDYDTSARPVKQFAIAQALYVLAGMAGRKYNVKGFGVNLYMMVAGNGGTGKGESRRSAQKRIASLATECEDQKIRQLFANALPASAPGLNQLLLSNDGVAAVYKEDAKAILSMMTTSLPGSNGELLNSALTSMWDQSGANKTVGAVSYSKKENSTVAIESPSLTLGLDIQIAPFKVLLGREDWIMEGGAARFVFATRHGKMEHARFPEDRTVVETEADKVIVSRLSLIWNLMRVNQTVVDIPLTQEAEQSFRDLETKCINRIRGGVDHYEILTRANMNALKIAGLLAIGDNHIDPLITLVHYEWASRFVLLGYNECLRLMDGGEVGAGEGVRVAKMIAVVKAYTRMKPIARGSYKVPASLDKLSNVIPESFLLEYLKSSKDFKGADYGKTTQEIIRATIEELVKQDYLVKSDRATVMTLYGVILGGNSRSPLYLLGDAL